MIPHPSTCPIVAALPAGLLPDTVVVCAPSDGQDAQGTSLNNTPGAPGPPLAASVQPVPRGLGTSYEGGDGTAPFGMAECEILFASDPGVSAAEQVLLWTHHAGGALPTPLKLRSTGEARRPGGLGARWTVSCTRTA